jgi:hypothetical protein
MNQPSRWDGWRPLALMLVVATALLVVVFRLLPYGIRGVNFAPVGAMLLFAGARLRPRWLLPIVIVPIVAVDLYFYAVKDWEIPFFSYVCFGIYVALGHGLLSRTESPVKIGLTTLLASVQFFLISNFGVWLGHVLRPQDYVGQPYQFAPNLAGLLNCYEVALPFFRGTFDSDLLFSALLFGAYAIGVRVYFQNERPMASSEEARS